MKRIILYCTMTTFMMTAGVQAQYVLDKIIGEVGGEFILLSDVEAQVNYIKSSYGEIESDTRCLVLQDLIAQKLLVNQAKLDSVVVTEEEVNQQIDARITQILSAMGNDEKRFEDYYGQTIEEVRREQQDNLRNQLYTQKMQSAVMEGVEATPEEVHEFFNKLPQDSLPYFNSEVEISEIAYSPPYSQENLDEAKSKAKDILAKIRADKSQFERLSDIYNDDPASKDNGGDLNWQPRGTFVPEFEAVAYNLETGEVSDVVRTEFGYHIIELLGRRGNLIHTRHILIKPEYDQSDLDKAKHTLDSIKHLLEVDSIPFEYVVRTMGNERAQSFNNGGRMTNPNTGTTYFEIGDLDSDVFFAIDNIEVSEYSEPVLIDKLNSDPIYKLLRLDSRSKAHEASLDLDYAKLQKLASERKKQRLFNEWLYDRISETHVRIDDDYTCPELELWLTQEEIGME